MLIYEVLKIRDFRKLLRLLFATPQKLLRDPLWGRDPPVGNHWAKQHVFDIKFEMLQQVHGNEIPLRKWSSGRTAHLRTLEGTLLTRHKIQSHLVATHPHDSAPLT